MQDCLRFYISPFTPDLLPLILPAALRETARDVSFHELLNFPERNYGYVTLPAMEGQKLRKKVNGSILRGSKVKVEEARPRKSSPEAASDQESGSDQPEAMGSRTTRKRKRQEGVIPGYELKDERKVKRGWTEPVASKIQEKKEKKGKTKDDKKASKKRQPVSEYTEDAECLFKTTVPPNKKDAELKTISKSKGKKGKEKTTVVHEFEHNEKHPTFLRDDARKGKKSSAKYDDEKGWVDDSGEVIEPKKVSKSKKKAAESTEKSSAVDHERMGSLTLREQEEGDDETSSSGSSGSGSSSESEAGSMKPPGRDYKASVSASPAPKISIEDRDKSTSLTPAPHPLETLYKKPAHPSTASEKNKANLTVEAVPFTFFSADGDAPATGNPNMSIETATFPPTPSAKIKRGAAARLPNLNIPPQTPFTQRDMMSRAQRSAAPTPDTAAPSKGGFPGFWARSRGTRLSTEEIEEEDDDEVMDSVEAQGGEEEPFRGQDTKVSEEPEGDAEPNAAADDTPVRAKSARAKKDEPSTFAKEFYEKRGELNRSWKDARREAGKTQRAAANRRKKG